MKAEEYITEIVSYMTGFKQYIDSEEIIVDRLDNEYVYEVVATINKSISKGMCPKKKDCLTAIARVMNKCGWELQIITNPRTNFSTVVALKR